MRGSFLLHIDSLCILDKMNEQQAGALIKAIYYYQQNNELPANLDFAIEMAVTPFINQFKRDNEKYEQVIEKRKQAGSMGGKQKVANVASATNAKQTVPNVAVNVNDNVNDNELPIQVIKSREEAKKHQVGFLDAETTKKQMEEDRTVDEFLSQQYKIRDNKNKERLLKSFFTDSVFINAYPRDYLESKKHFKNWCYKKQETQPEFMKPYISERTDIEALMRGEIR